MDSEILNMLFIGVHIFKKKGGYFFNQKLIQFFQVR